MRGWACRIACGVVLVLALHKAGRGQEADSMPTLERIMVTERVVAEANVTTVDYLDSLRLRSMQVTTLAEALAYLPGIHVRRGARQEAYVRARGLRQREVLILLDGRPVNSPYTGQFDLDRIPVDHIERIEFIRGAPSPLYGSGTAGGVIRITTKSPTDSLLLAGDVTGEGTPAAGPSLPGTTVRTTAQASKGFGPVSLIAVGRYEWSEGYAVPVDFEPTEYQTERLRLNSDRRKADLFICAEALSDRAHNFSLSVDLGTGENGAPPMVVDTLPVTGLPKNVKFSRVDDYSMVGVNLATRHAFTERFRMRTRAYFNTASAEENQYASEDFATVAKHYPTADKTLGVGLDGHVSDIWRGELRLALSARFDRSRQDGWVDLNSSGRLPGETWTPDLVYLDYSSALALYEGAVEYNAAPLSWMKVSVGGGISLFDAGGLREGESGESRYDQRMRAAPRAGIGVSFLPFRKGEMYLLYSLTARFPSLRELYSIDYKRRPNVVAFVGLPDVEPEQAHNGEVGIRQRFGDRASVSVAAFYSRIENLIEKEEYDTIMAGELVEIERYANVPASRLIGLECEGSVSPVKPWMLSCALSLLQAVVTEDSESQSREELQYRPSLKLSWMSRYSLPWGMTAMMDGIVVGKQYFYDGSLKYKLPAYGVVNAALRQSLWSRVRLSVGVRNLFDTEYYESYGLLRPGRSFFVRLGVGT